VLDSLVFYFTCASYFTGFTKYREEGKFGHFLLACTNTQNKLQKKQNLLALCISDHKSKLMVTCRRDEEVTGIVSVNGGSGR